MQSNCAKCNRLLDSDDIGASKKLINRGMTEGFCCKACLAKEFGVKMTLDHVTEGHLIVEELASEDYPLAVGPTLTSASKFELRNKAGLLRVFLQQPDVR